MIDVTASRSIPVPPDKAWGVLKTFRLDYFPGYRYTLTGEGVGTERTFRLPDGEMTERIVTLDDEAMALTYEIVAGSWPVREYLASIRVEEADGGAAVTWTAEFEPDGAPEEKAVELVAGTFRMNLKALEKYLTS